MPNKSVCFWGWASATGLSPRSPPPLSACGFNFWLWGGSSPFVILISGYACTYLGRLHHINIGTSGKVFWGN